MAYVRVATGLFDARNAVAARAKLYESDQSGLKSKFQQAKAAVAAQFGRRSPEYQTIAHIRH